MNRPHILGITGGIASGKSEVTRILAAQGAVIIHADQIGHQVLHSDELREPLLALFGNEILAENLPSSTLQFTAHPPIDRKKVAQLVFGSTDLARERKAKLEALTHPRIRRQIRREIEQAINGSPNASDPLTPVAEIPTATPRNSSEWIVLDVPLLFESGWSNACDVIWFIDASTPTRLARAKQRGWSEQDFLNREATQLPTDQKIQRADLVIPNNGTLADLSMQVEEALRKSIAFPLRKTLRFPS